MIGVHVIKELTIDYDIRTVFIFILTASQLTGAYKK